MKKKRVYEQNFCIIYDKTNFFFLVEKKFEN